MFCNSVVIELLFLLLRIHTIPSVPIVDCFQKIRQQVKCYLQMSGVMGKNELQEVVTFSQCSSHIFCNCLPYLRSGSGGHRVDQPQVLHQGDDGRVLRAQGNVSGADRTIGGRE